ncbi:MAG TPA: hypothetical protein VHW04_11330 [Solirubrobacteraceae bacterium]|nr:hypothetical protein [Solirubrobacteraceae bacterium]
MWRYDKPVRGCRGFALYRKPDGKPEEPVQTFVPLAGQPHDPGEHRPSTEWPIQRYSWTDVLARTGDLMQYRVVPMIGTAGDLTGDTAHATAWTQPVEVTAKASDELYAYFNRGVLATQSIARRLDATKPWQKQLTTMINTSGPEDNDTWQDVYFTGPTHPPSSESSASGWAKVDEPLVCAWCLAS